MKEIEGKMKFINFIGRIIIIIRIFQSGIKYIKVMFISLRFQRGNIMSKFNCKFYLKLLKKTKLLIINLFD